MEIQEKILKCIEYCKNNKDKDELSDITDNDFRDMEIVITTMLEE